MQNRLRFLIALAALIFLASAGARGQESAETKRLQKERAELLDGAIEIEIAVAGYEKGAVTFDSLMSVLREARKAGLDASQDTNGRIASLKAGLQTRQRGAKDG